MSFDELWNKVEETGVLPNTAIYQIPGLLSDEVKNKLRRKKPEEVARLVSAAVEEVNGGSVDRLENLIRKRL